MYLRHLSLTHFRNFGRLELALGTGTHLFAGPNAQGKTNLLESIYYLATTRTPYTTNESELLHWDAGDEALQQGLIVGRIVAQVMTKEGLRLLELRLIKETAENGTSRFRREALLDRHKVRLLDLLGQLRVVLFLPQDLDLITGAPSQRRRHLDVTLCQVDRAYCQQLTQYDKVLEQRNALLRQLAEQKQRTSADLLAIYNEKLAQSGAHLLQKRARFIQSLAREVQRLHYEWLTGQGETLRLTYLPHLTNASGSPRTLESPEAGQEKVDWLLNASLSEIGRQLQACWEETLSADLARAATNIGPHRDDWHCWINGRSARAYGSRGQQRTAILSLKLGELFWMQSQTGELPILLLDDVLAELDAQRHNLLLAQLPQLQQTLITTADSTAFSAEFMQQCHLYHIEQGRIQQHRPPLPSTNYL